MLYIKISCLISQFVISCHVATRYIKIIITSDEKDPYLYATTRKIHIYIYIYLQSASSLMRRYSMNDNHQGLVLKILTPFLNIMTKKNIFAVFFNKKCSLCCLGYHFEQDNCLIYIAIYIFFSKVCLVVLLPAPHFEPYNQTAGFSPIEDAPLKPSISFKKYGCYFL